MWCPTLNSPGQPFPPPSNVRRRRAPAGDVDSESEDQPRKILNHRGEFNVVEGDKTCVTGTLEELYYYGLRYFKNVSLAIRPKSDPEVVARTVDMMGNGINGVWTGTIFEPPPDQPAESVFANRLINAAIDNRNTKCPRFCIRRRYVPGTSTLSTLALYTDGACVTNSHGQPRGGFAFLYNANGRGTVSGTLELKGPTREIHPQTNKRAELRAALAALMFRMWWGEGWKRVVVITDSEYVSEGATGWLRKWAARGWKTAAGKPVANRDLWEALSEAMASYAKGGCEISFWLVPRAWNTKADLAARSACLSDMPRRHLYISGRILPSKSGDEIIGVSYEATVNPETSVVV